MAIYIQGTLFEFTQPKQEIEYISAFNITAAVETRPSQLHSFLYFTPPPPSLTSYVPPPPSSARFCDTRICLNIFFFVLFFCSLAHRLVARNSLLLYILYRFRSTTVRSGTTQRFVAVDLLISNSSQLQAETRLELTLF